MRFPISISDIWYPIFRVCGFARGSSYVDVGETSVRFGFGTADERVPLSSIQGARRTEWPFYYGLGAKLSPRNGVAYVGSTEGVVEVRLREPQRLNVWGPFRRGAAERIVVSLEDPEGFLTSLEHALERHRTGSA